MPTLAGRGILLLGAVLLGRATALAQGGPIVFNRTGSGARAAGMANAFIAISDDGTAASWNPAGLGQLRKPELSVVSTTSGQAFVTQGFRTRDDLSVFTTGRSSYWSTYLDFASLAVPLTLWHKPVTFQGAWRRLYTMDDRELVSMNRVPVTAEAPPPARIDSNTDLLGSVDLISIAGAVKLTPRLALGASFNLWRGDWTENDSISELPLTGSSVPQFLTLSGRNRIRGNNVALGLMLTYPRWSVGLLHHLPLRSSFEGRVATRTSGAAARPEETGNGTLRFPREIGLGGAWRPATRWTVGLDLTWDNWRAALIETSAGGPQPGRPISIFDGLPPDQTSTRNTLSVNAGAEHLFPGEEFVVPLRFGLAWEPQGGRDAYTRDPVSYVMLAAGTGYNTNSLKFDAAFQLRWAHFLTGANFGVVEVGPLPLAVGERDVREWRLKLSLILRVTDTDKLHRTIRKVFGGS